MSKNARVLESGICEITQEYKGLQHGGIDIVNKGYTLGNIVAHTEGQVVEVRNNCTGFESSGSYGNYVKIKHSNGYYTLYAHMAYNTVKVSKGQRVSKGQLLGYMGATGTAYGGHLHFEVRNTSDVRIDPTSYLDANLPNSQAPTKSVEELAQEVIAGKYGNGEDRKKALGDRYSEVQARVNEILAPAPKPNVDILDLVRKTIRGDFGNGDARKNALGSNYAEIQKQVNLNFQNKTTNWDSVRLY